MVDNFTQTTTTSFGGRIGNSIKGILLGIVLIIASFVILYWNEGRVDLSTISKNAVELKAAAVNTDQALNGRFIFATDVLKSEAIINDNLFLNSGKYVAVERKVEMYSWKEKIETKSETNLGGSETVNKTYSYSKDWEEKPADSSIFKYTAGHENPEKGIKSDISKASNVTFGAYGFDISKIQLPPFEKISLNSNNVTLSQGATLVNSDYIFIGKSASSTFANPQIGDMRVSYGVIYPGKTVTIFGKLDGGNISPYYYKDNLIYRIFSGARDEALATMHGEYTLLLWVLRLVGFMMMWWGLSLLLEPISVLLDILPIVGSLSRTILGLIAFVVALVLSFATIIVSMIIHNIIALVITIVVVIVAIYMLFIMKKNKSSSTV